MKKEEKLLKIYEYIDKTCSSSVKRFDASKHTSRSVGFTAYEERQKALLDLAKENPEIIQILRENKKGGHSYFKFEGRVVKIISSHREPLSKQVFSKNTFEVAELDLPDPLLRIIYKANYDIENHESIITECHYLEVNRNTGEIMQEIDILRLSKIGYVEEIVDDKPDAVELPPANLIFSTSEQKANNDNGKNDKK